MNYKQRVFEEHKQLLIKICRLQHFLEKIEGGRSEETDILSKQLSAMNEYCEILEVRLLKFLDD